MKIFMATLLALTVLIGCSKPSVRIALTSSPKLNLNDAKEALPVVLRIYQLGDDGLFRNAQFSELWKKDVSALGDSLLARDEIVVNPAAREKLAYSRHDKAKFIAVMGVFRRPGDKGWRDIVPVKSGWFSRNTALEVQLKGNTVDIVD